MKEKKVFRTFMLSVVCLGLRSLLFAFSLPFKLSICQPRLHTNTRTCRKHSADDSIHSHDIPLTFGVRASRKRLYN